MILQIAPILTPDAVRESLALARRCFDALDEATDEGRSAFRSATEFPTVQGHILAGDLKLWGCADSDLRAMGALRGGEHITFLFVDKRYRLRGLGEALVEAMRDEATTHGHTRLTANATPSSLGFYERLGFEQMAEEQTRDGITFIPVELDLSEDAKW